MRISLLIAALTAFLTTSAQAAPLRFEIDGTVPLYGEISFDPSIPLNLLSGSFTFDPATGQFRDVAFFQAFPDDPNAVSQLDVPFGRGNSTDLFFGPFDDVCPLSGARPPCPLTIEVQIAFPGGIPTERGTVPIEALLYFFRESDTPGITETFDGFPIQGSGTITVSAVPLPSGLWLALGGLAALLGLGRAVSRRLSNP